MCLVKYGLYFTNIFLILSGIALIGVSAAAFLQLSEVLEFIPPSVRAIPIIAIVLGILILSIATFGYCGAAREKRSFLVFYALSMLLLAAGKSYLALVIFKNTANIEDLVEGWFGYAFINDVFRDRFHAIENAFFCCGTTGPISYKGVLADLPATCCPGVEACKVSNAYSGCSIKMSIYCRNFGEAIAVVIAVIAAVELVAMVFSFCFCREITKKKRETV